MLVFFIIFLSLFIVFNAINQNVDHFSLLFSLFFSKLVTSTQISNVEIAEICPGCYKASTWALGAVICKQLSAAKGN